MRQRGNKSVGFTIIEVLVLAATLTLIAAIAIPNLTDARSSTQVAQAKSDLRAIKTGLELYKVDQGGYILMNLGNYCLHIWVLNSIPTFPWTRHRLAAFAVPLSTTRPMAPPARAASGW
jgi:type II secretory pathway pseudopilin PulG